MSVNFVKPAVMRKGYWMTVAVLDADYRVVNENKILDFRGTVAKLRQMEDVLNMVVAEEKSLTRSEP